MQVANLKRDFEQRHENELRFIKERWRAKLEHERMRIQDENSQLIEQSTDIKGNLQLYKNDLLENKMDEKKFELKEEQRNRLTKHKQTINDMLDQKRA